MCVWCSSFSSSDLCSARYRILHFCLSHHSIHSLSSILAKEFSILFECRKKNSEILPSTTILKDETRKLNAKRASVYTSFIYINEGYQTIYKQIKSQIFRQTDLILYYTKIHNQSLPAVCVSDRNAVNNLQIISIKLK